MLQHDLQPKRKLRNANHESYETFKIVVQSVPAVTTNVCDLQVPPEGKGVLEELDEVTDFGGEL